MDTNQRLHPHGQLPVGSVPTTLAALAWPQRDTIDALDLHVPSGVAAPLSAHLIVVATHAVPTPTATGEAAR